MTFASVTYLKTIISNGLDKFPAALKPMCLGISLSLSISPLGNAANIPNLDKPVDFNVREQNVNDFLNALFQEIDVPLSINSEFEGNINGQFNDTAGDVFGEIANAFDLLVYYDGAVAQAYRTNEVTRRLFPASAAQSKKAAGIISRMNLPDRRNTIVLEESGLLVSGTNRFLAQVEEVLDSVKRIPTAPRKTKTVTPESVEVSEIYFPKESPIVYQTFKLKHAWAIDTSFPVGGQTITIPGVATLLGQLLLGHDNSVYEDPAAGDTNALEGLRGKGLSKQPDKSPQIKTITPSSMTVPRIVADSRLNAIIIRDYAANMPSYRRLIDSLDVESSMVEIEATIIDINTDKTRDLGINWRYQGTDGAIQFGSGGAGDQALIPGNGDLAQGRGGVLSFMLGEPADFLGRIRALEEKGAARVVSKPHVITLSDVEAILSATTEFFVRVAGDEEVDLFNVPVGTTLRVTPSVFDDNRANKIKLLVNIEDGSQSTASQVDSIPVIERANISTQAVINEGDSLLVGGLVRETYRNTSYQVPILGRIPLLGALFRSKQNQATRVERLFLITPRLASGIGFDGKNQPALSGNINQIVNDASRRIRNTSFTDRPPMTYWSKRSRDVGENITPQPNRFNKGTPPQAPDMLASREIREIPARKSPLATTSANTSIRTRDSAPNRSGYAVIEDNIFISPFTVEPW